MNHSTEVATPRPDREPKSKPRRPKAPAVEEAKPPVEPDRLAELDEAVALFLDLMEQEHEAKALLGDHPELDEDFPGDQDAYRIERARRVYLAEAARWSRHSAEIRALELIGEAYPEAPEPRRHDFEHDPFHHAFHRVGDFTVIAIRGEKAIFLDHRGHKE